MTIVKTNEYGALKIAKCYAIVSPDLQLAGEYSNASSAGYCEESELEDEVKCIGSIGLLYSKDQGPICF